MLPLDVLLNCSVRCKPDQQADVICICIFNNFE